MEKTILNFHFDYLTPTLTITLVPEKRGKGQKLQDVQAKTILAAQLVQKSKSANRWTGWAKVAQMCLNLPVVTKSGHNLHIFDQRSHFDPHNR